jgi:hypothetical protein
MDTKDALVVLLQELWIEYALIIDGIDTAIEQCDDFTSFIDRIDELITDTPKVAALRARLIKAGVCIE